LEGGTLSDVIGYLVAGTPVRPDGRTVHLADAAIAWSPDNVITGVVDVVGPVRGIRVVSSEAIDERVRKVGSATGLTEGRVLAIAATIRADYMRIGLMGSAVFVNQIVTTPMGAYGDSGALLIDGGSRAVGMLFSGGRLGTAYAPISTVLRSLGVFIPTRSEGL